MSILTSTAFTSKHWISRTKLAVYETRFSWQWTLITECVLANAAFKAWFRCKRAEQAFRQCWQYHYGSQRLGSQTADWQFVKWVAATSIALWRGLAPWAKDCVCDPLHAVLAAARCWLSTDSTSAHDDFWCFSKPQVD